MREILFKAKRKNWKDLPKEEWWVEGYYVPYVIEGGIIHHFLLTGEADLVETKDDELVLNFYWIEIDPETLCQYIGLLDKNDKKIWENDVVAFLDTTSTESSYYEANCCGIVSWDSGTASFRVSNMTMEESYEVLDE